MPYLVNGLPVFPGSRIADTLLYCGRFQGRRAIEKSSFSPSFGKPNPQTLAGSQYAPADVEDIAAVQANVMKYAHETAVPTTEFTDAIPIIQQALKVMYGDAFVVDDVDFEDAQTWLETELSNCWGGAAGLVWDKNYKNKRSVKERALLQNLFYAFINGAFLIPFFDKSCNKTELRAIENGATKTARGFTPCQYHDYFGSVVLLSRALNRMLKRGWCKIGQSFLYLGFDELFNTLRAAQLKLDLPDKWCCSDISGNDKRQRDFHRKVFYDCYQVPENLRDLFEHLCKQVDASYLVDQNGFTFYRSCGLSSGKQITLGWNTFVNTVFTMFVLIVRGVTFANLLDWPVGVFGDDNLCCWPFDGSYSEDFNKLITPMGGLTASNENYVETGEAPQCVKLEDAQFLSFRFVESNGKHYPCTITPNKCLMRLELRTPNEDRKALIEGFLYLHYYHPVLRQKLMEAYLADFPGDTVGLHAILRKAIAMHNSSE